MGRCRGRGGGHDGVQTPTHICERQTQVSNLNHCHTHTSTPACQHLQHFVDRPVADVPAPPSPAPGHAVQRHGPMTCQTPSPPTRSTTRDTGVFLRTTSLSNLLKTCTPPTLEQHTHDGGPDPNPKAQGCRTPCARQHFKIPGHHMPPSARTTLMIHGSTGRAAARLNCFGAFLFDREKQTWDSKG